MLSFVPIILLTGPLAGFFVGDYLRKKFGFVPYTTIITMAIGFIASISETVRIIKLAYTIANKK